MSHQRNDESVVLIFGISGCGIKPFLNSLHNPAERRFATRLSQRHWQGALEARHLRDELEEQIDEVQTNIKSRPGKYFVALHATHLAEAFSYSAIPIDALRSLRPTFCITLFDDLYAIQARLRTKGYPYSYRDLMLWLRTEFLMADWIAEQIVDRSARVKNFLLGVKHPKSTVTRLATNSNLPKIYAACSITGIVREQNRSLKLKLLTENIAYRLRLQQFKAIVFDPGTLDDRIVINKVMHDDRPRAGQIVVNESERWPYVIGRGVYSPAVMDPDDAFPINLPHVEAFVLKTTPQSPHRPYSDIDALITQVDLHYVSQSDVVTIWRPFCRGTHSIGCSREAQTAASSDKKTIAYCPRQDLDLLTKESRPLQDMWPREVPLIEDEKEFWKELGHLLDEGSAPFPSCLDGAGRY